MVAEMIRSGRYFQEALDWYDEKYHTPIIEKAYAIFITIIALLSTVFAIVAVVDFLPVTVKMPMLLKLEDLDQYDISVRPLSEDTNDSNRVVLHYLLGEYVRARENYVVSRFQSDVNRVRASSSKEEFIEFMDYIAPSNPASPITRYERHTERQVEVASMDFGEMDDDFDAEKVIPSQVTVFFVARTSGAENEVTRWKAMLRFDYTPFTINQENFTATPMKLVVTDYRVEQLVSSK